MRKLKQTNKKNHFQGTKQPTEPDLTLSPMFKLSDKEFKMIISLMTDGKSTLYAS